MSNKRPCQPSLFSFLKRKRADLETDQIEHEDEQVCKSTEEVNRPTTSTSTSTSSSVTYDEPTPAEKIKIHGNFQEKWRVDYPWLRTDTDMVMFCATCQDTRQKNGFTSALSEHSKSRSHASAVTSLAKQPSMKGHSDAARAKKNEYLKAQLRTVLCMATQHIASNNFEALMELQKENGCSSLRESSKGSECKIYKHHESVAEMEDSLASVNQWWEKKWRKKLMTAHFLVSLSMKHWTALWTKNWSCMRVLKEVGGWRLCSRETTQLTTGLLRVSLLSWLKWWLSGALSRHRW